MMIASFLSTFQLAIWASSLGWVNILLSFPILPIHSSGQIGCPAKDGKVIKESIIEKKDFQIKTVVIDPGHGGHDPGCSGSKSKEKDIALKIGLNLSKKLKANYPDLKVIMTRSKDVFIPLHERAAIANKNKADLFISIHCNYIPSKQHIVHGSETYVMGLHRAKDNLDVAKRENAAILYERDYEKRYDYDPNSNEGHILLSMYQNAYLDQSILFAEKVEAQFKIKAKRKSRGVKQAGFLVLRETTMPSVLVEVGFLSHKKEQEYLLTSQGQLTISEALFNAFKSYKKDIDGNNSGQMTFLESTYKNRQPKVLSEPIEVQPTKPAAPAYNYQPKELPSNDSGKVVYGRIAKYQGPKSNEFTEKSVQSKTLTPPLNRKAIYSNRPLPSDLQIKVQLAASTSPLNTELMKWKNIAYPIEIVREKEVYKYQARNFKSINEAAQAKDEWRLQGFPEAFVVAYKDGKRIPIEDAVKLVEKP